MAAPLTQEQEVTEGQQLPCVLKAVVSSEVGQVTSIRTRVQPVKILRPSPAKISNSEAPTQSQTMQCPALSIHDMEAEPRKKKLKEEAQQGPGPRLLMEDHRKPVSMYGRDSGRVPAHSVTSQETSKTFQCQRKIRSLPGRILMTRQQISRR